MTIGSLLDRIERFEMPRDLPIRIALGDLEFEIEGGDYEMFGYRKRGLILRAKNESGQPTRRRRLSKDCCTQMSDHPSSPQSDG